MVLAGGRAARLGGADKPGLMIGGRPLLDAVAGAAVAADTADSSRATGCVSRATTRRR